MRLAGDTNDVRFSGDGDAVSDRDLSKDDEEDNGGAWAGGEGKDATLP